ncbi:hypothetical protein GXP67_31250 [Rhodocytophaga rosea]|uniref:T9SS type A sorting domain-containing protein n=1 Tax=Rhodocytophaga rosea TaxID=2704465 RepID=A0A6C0GRW7_9BACT|nr:hypothetical protein [Rhodocytophaga rosea]QHT70809.1 hypothetical protein GXP67_31250 [Rhodocytophaga rosea]
MKKLLPLLSLTVFMAIYNIDCSAQALAANITEHPATNSKKDITDSASNLAALVIQSQENKFSVGVHVENREEGKFTVMLKSAASILHKEVVNDKMYARKYDMYNLPVGDYLIEIVNEKEAFTKKITISKK